MFNCKPKQNFDKVLQNYENFGAFFTVMHSEQITQDRLSYEKLLIAKNKKCRTCKLRAICDMTISDKKVNQQNE